MNNLAHKHQNSSLRHKRVRSRVVGLTDRPRLTVHISNRNIYVQIVNDELKTTIASVSTVGSKQTGNLTEKAVWVGQEIAKKAQAAKISKVTFDRGSRLYHGRVKALADAAREKGLEF